MFIVDPTLPRQCKNEDGCYGSPNINERESPRRKAVASVWVIIHSTIDEPSNLLSRKRLTNSPGRVTIMMSN